MTIGEKIKQRRTELGWSLRELSNRMGYSNHSTIARIESGSVDIPQSRIVQFAEVLGVSVAYLMGWETPPEEMQEKNDTAVDIVKRLGYDKDFCELVKLIYKLDSKQIASVRNMLGSFIQ